MKKIRVAHFGIAHDHSIFAMESLRQHPEVFEIVGVCEPDEDTRRKFGGHEMYAGLNWLTEEELLARNDVDAVLCEGHELRSVSDAQKCIDRGWHVHLDKPGGVDMAAFEHLMQSAQQKKLTVQMGYMYRYNPAMKYVLETVRSGKLGRITAIDAAFSIQHTPEKRRWMRQFPGGMMFFLGCHLVDLIYRIMGEPEEVIPMNASTGIDGVTAEDYGLAMFKYKSGMSFAKSCAMEPGGFMRRQLVVCGSKGTVRIMPLEAFCEGGQYTEWHEIDRKITDWGTNGEYFKSEPFKRYDDMFIDFAKIVCGEKENEYDYDYEIKLHDLVLKACGA